MSVRGRLIAPESVDPELHASWSALAERALEPNPFAAPELALPAARWLADGADIHLLTVFDGDVLLLALPVRRSRSYRRVPAPTFQAWGHQHAYVDTPLVAPDDPEAAWRAALDALEAEGGAWLALERMPAGGPVGEALEAATGGRGLRVLGVQERPVLRRRERATYLDGRLSSQRRKRLRRGRRRLEAQLGGPVALTRCADVPAAVNRFLALERGGWKGRDGTALACDPGATAWFRSALAAGEPQLWELGRPGRSPVAALCAVVAGRTAFHLKVAYDERFAACSPGLQLEVAVVEAFHDDPALDAIDSCTTDGADSPSALLYPDRREYQSLLVVLGGRTSRAAALALDRVLCLRHG